MKVVTLKEAERSGRRFRAGFPPTDAKSHVLETGHVWRVPYTGTELERAKARFPGTSGAVICAECRASLRVLAIMPDQWILEKTDEELEADAIGILNSVQIKAREPVGVK